MRVIVLFFVGILFKLELSIFLFGVFGFSGLLGIGDVFTFLFLGFVIIRRKLLVKVSMEV